MRLSTSEMKLLSTWSTRKRRRKREAWLSILIVTVLMVVTYGYGLIPQFEDANISGYAMAASLMYLVHAYFGYRPEDKLIDLVQRYINCDPEAVAQLAGETESNELAA